MNYEETLYLIFKEHYNSDTLIKERTSYSGPFKMYTEYDIENLNYLQEQLRLSQKPDVDLDTITAIYQGQNVFSIFYENEQLL